MTATWPAVDADTAVAALETHHRRGKERTDAEEAAVKARTLACTSGDDLRQAAGLATGGVIESGVTGDEPPPWLTTCAYDNGGHMPPALTAWRNDTGAPIALDSSTPDPSLIPGVVEVPHVGRWVVGRGWVPVDGLGPHEGASR
jgi:hypothetical protein